MNTYIYNKFKNRKIHIISPVTGKTYCKFENSDYSHLLNSYSEEIPKGRKLCNICKKLQGKDLKDAGVKKRTDVKKGKKESRKNKEIAREFLIKHFRLHRYASNISICLCIHNECGIEVPGSDAKASVMIIEYWRKLKGRNNQDRKDYKYMPADEFYSSKKWRELRFVALRLSGGSCTLCGASAKDGIQLHVDHIKPRSKYPKLQFDLDNLQILCQDCNLGKSNYDETDFR